MEFEAIIYEKKDNVAWITLNRPKVLNAQNETMLSELIKLMEQIRVDDEVHVIVLTGAGDKAFCAGADQDMLLVWTPIEVIKKFRGGPRPYYLFREIPKPTIAMVNGFAFGGGCELALQCDIIIASENAQFGQLEINVGVIPGGGGTQVWPRLVGDKKARELIYTGDIISAQEALRLGVVNQVVPQDKLRETVEKLIGKLKKKSPAILRLAKIAINKSLDEPLSMGLEAELDLFAMAFGTEDQKEGARAFLEKRAPNYKGK
jgi:enoyl-CoA hydratase